jgi:exopolysaccharide production protein ExoQ
MADLDLPRAVTGRLAAASMAEDTLFERAIWLPAYLVVALLALGRWRAILLALSAQRGLIVLLSLALGSTLWSIHPDDTLRRSVALIFTSLAGVYLGVRYDVRRLVVVLGWTLAIIIGASLVCAVVRPDLAIMPAPYPGAWRGVFTHKNALGHTMLLACDTFVALMLIQRRVLFWLTIGLVAALTLVFLSTAVTPLIVGFATLPALILARQYGKDRKRFGLILALALTIALLIAVLLLPPMALILQFLGKDTTLTGRTEIWELVWAAIQPRFWLGYGFGAFWVDIPSENNPVFTIWDAVNWRVPNAHSGLLELWLSIGLVGTIVFVILVISGIADSFRRFARTDLAAFSWIIALYVFIFVYSITDSNAMDHNSLDWALFVAIATVSRTGGPLAQGLRRPVPAFWKPTIAPTVGTGSSASPSRRLLR